MRRLSRRSTGVGLTVLVGLSAAGAAWAAWNLTGSGTAQAKAGEVVALEVTSAGLADGVALAPGNPTSIKLNVRNKNRFPVRITNIDLTNLTSSSDGCVGKENVTVLNEADLPAADAVLVPAAAEGGSAVKEIVWSGPLRMINDPAEACQGAGFNFNVHLDAVSAAS
jgi:hypothetical protein